MKLFAKLHKRLGDFWWYSVLLFAATRVGDLINAFIGLWLVPKFVPMDELGAVLPLGQFAATLALPISIFGMAFMKYVNILAVDGKKGQVKSLLRGVFLAAAIFLVLALIVARITMAPVFERLRIARGMLGLLILSTGFLGAVAPVYSNALQALKRFQALSWLTALGAPIRLVVMLVTMPIRALSGYFAAQSSVCLWQIVCSVFALRKDLGPSVRPEPFWTRANTRAFLKYCACVTLYFTPQLSLFVEALIIRQRLTPTDSAAYYMISRFAEIGTYAGATLLAVMFPFVSEAAQKGGDPDRFIVRSTLASTGFGLVCAAGFLLTGRGLLALLPGGTAYVGYVPQLAVLTLVLALFAALNCALTGEVAAGRFGFLKWSVPLHLGYVAVLYFITGHGYVDAWLPAVVVDGLNWINACGLDWVLVAMLSLQLVKAVCIFTPIVIRRGKKSGRAY